ncbi:MAG: hypothetical protein WCO78_02180 [Candidatus Roizmanbacteria bacterium]
MNGEILTRFNADKIMPDSGTLPEGTVVQVHSGRHTPESFASFLTTFSLETGLVAALDLVQKRRFELDSGSRVQTSIKDGDRDPSQQLEVGESVYVGMGNPDIEVADHILRPNYNIIGVKQGETLGLGDTAQMTVTGEDANGLHGTVFEVDDKRPKIFSGDGFTAPSWLNERLPDEPLLSARDLEFLNAVPADQRHKLGQVALSFVGDPQKVVDAQNVLVKMGYERAEVHLKIETKQAIDQLEQLANLPGVNIVFACGDLSEVAKANAGNGTKWQLHNLIGDGLRRLNKIGFNGKTAIAYDYGENIDSAETQRRYRLLSVLERRYNRPIGMWHTRIGMKQKTSKDLSNTVNNSREVAHQNAAELQARVNALRSIFRSDLSDINTSN